MLFERLTVYLGLIAAMFASITSAANGGVLEEQLRAAAEHGNAAQVEAALKQGPASTPETAAVPRRC